MTRKKLQRQVNILHILEGVVLEKEQQYSWDTSFQIPQALEKKKRGSKNWHGKYKCTGLTHCLVYVLAAREGNAWKYGERWLLCPLL